MFALDFEYIIRWWLFFFLLGFSMFPLVWLIFRRFFDLGIGLAKTFGLLIISYLAYLGAISHILPLTNIALYSIFIFFALANLFIFSKNKKDIVSDLKSKAKNKQKKNRDRRTLSKTLVSIAEEYVQ